MGIEDEQGNSICTMEDPPNKGGDALAEIMIRSCNGHTALLEALRECVTEDGAHCFAADIGHYERHRLLASRLHHINLIALAAIAKATGQG